MANSTPTQLTILTSAHQLPTTKKWTVVDGKIACEPYGRENHWYVQTRNIRTTADLYHAIRTLADRRDCIVIRGDLRPDATPVDGGAYLRRCVGAGAPFRAVPRQWVALDIDGLPIPAKLLGADHADQIRWVITQLPTEWSWADCVFQFTSSHRMVDDSMRCRLWFLLDAPVTDFCLKQYWKKHADALCVDTSLFNAVQPHYVNAPLFEGVTDPLPLGRVGFIESMMGSAMPASLLWTEEERLATSPEQDACSLVPEGQANREQITRALAKIDQAAVHGSRHHALLGACCELVGLGCTLEAASPVLEGLMHRHGRDARGGELAEAWSFAVQKARNGTLTTANAPMHTMFPTEVLREASPDGETGVLDIGEVVADTPVQEWSKNDRTNALQYLRQYHDAGTLLRVNETDYEWAGGCWQALEAEALQGRVARAIAQTSRVVTSTVNAIRQHIGEEGLAAPCWRSTRRSAARVVSFANGNLDVDRWLKSGGEGGGFFSEPTPDLFSTTVLPYCFDPRATCPTFDRFLEDAFPRDAETQREIIKMMGYLLTPDVSQQALFVLMGIRGSGKSTLANVITELVGRNNYCAPTLINLCQNFGKQTTVGKLLAVVSEANHTGRSSMEAEGVDFLKRATVGDPVQIDRKRKDPLTVRLSIRFLMVCNRIPVMPDASLALARRIQLYEFRNSFVGKEDRQMESKLRRELSGIANKALLGLQYLQEDGGFRRPKASETRMREYMHSMAPLTCFIEDCCDIRLDAAIGRADLYSAYKAWCYKNGRGPMNSDGFARDLMASGEAIDEVRQGSKRSLRGVTLKPECMHMVGPTPDDG